MATLRVISVPGLSARVLHDRADELPSLCGMVAATVAVLDGASPEQLEAALITGLLPEYHNRPGVLPFWHGLSARVETEHPLRETWRAWGKRDLQLDLRTSVFDLVALEAEAGGDAPLVILSSCAFVHGSPVGQHAHPLDRPVLLTRGLEQSKNCVGILEIAGILRRALTGERLTDAL
ncbi:MAG: hypothetical protein K8I27_11250 [Planctomycetes bacterium]|nr:hypothetical protein [Planctomycetota bacterium]